MLLLGLLSGSLSPAGEPAASTPASATLRINVLDDATRRTVPCTVTLIDSNGTVLTEGAGLKGAFRSTGSFEKTLPPGPTQIRVVRGPEYRAALAQVDLRQSERRTLELVLQRQVNLRQRGWYAGDSHAHMVHGERTVPVGFDDVALAARAEDLQYLSLAHAWNLENPTPERLQAELGRRSTPDCVLTWNIEAPKNYYLGDAGRCLGHCWTLGLPPRTADGLDVIQVLLQSSAADYESDKPSIANFESHALIRELGGRVFYTHPARWWMGAWGGKGGYPRQESMRVSNLATEMPLDVVCGPTFDGVDVLTGPGELEANLKAFKLWVLLLNHGYRLSATASSDACFDRPGDARPGSARLYTLIEGGFSLPAAAQAAAEGRTFATTGPLVVTSLDGRPPGSALKAAGQPHTLRIEAWASGTSTGGLAAVEVLRNGQTLHRQTLENHPRTFETNLTVLESTNAWYCVRVTGAGQPLQQAITGAFYLEATPWQTPPPVQALVHVRVVDASTDRPLDATITEVRQFGNQARPGTRHILQGGEGRLPIPATVRLRAESKGYPPVTLSPFLDSPALVKLITNLGDDDLLNWETYERCRAALGHVELTFRMRSQ